MAEGGEALGSHLLGGFVEIRFAVAADIRFAEAAETAAEQRTR